MPVCTNCGAQAQSSDQFCGNCGQPITVARPASTPRPGVAAAAQDLPCLLSPTRILLMSVLSHGLYLFYWSYLTWKQYRDHTGKEAYPVWHGLAVAFVPIYSLFRTHAHWRSFKELMDNAGVTNTLSPGWAVVWVTVSSSLELVALPVLLGGQVTQGSALLVVLLGLGSLAVVAGLLLQTQDNLNRYWRSLTHRKAVYARMDAGEVIVAVLGIVSWTDTITFLLNPAYRGWTTG